MKKITLLLLLLLLSISGYSQFTPTVEGFESTTGPDAGTNWTLSTGNWAVFDNGVGLGQRWGINTLLPYQGANAAYVNRENIGAGNTSEDYLASPLVHVPTNGQLHFFTRTFSSGNQGTIYRVMVASGANSQTDPASYGLVQEWTEATISNPFNVYTPQTVSLTDYADQDVYIAFVMVWNQTGTALGDRWLVDDVSLVEQCTDPTALTTLATTSTTATLTWGNPSGATSWEIEVVPSTGTPTGVGTVYSGALPYIKTGLLPNTSYTFYVKAICTNSSSLWVGPSSTFTTQVAPPECGGNYVDSGGAAGNYANNENITTTICPATTGDVVTVNFTAFNTEAGNDILKIYNGDSALGTLLGTFSGATIPPSFTSSAANGCLTFVFTSDAGTTSTGWSSTITCGPPPACPQPIALSANTVLSTSATLAWTNAGSATTWQVLALPCSSPAPTAGTTGWTSTTSNPFTIPNLTPDTCYKLYVRSDCSASSNGVSEWAGPVQITTQIAPPVCGGTFVDTGGSNGNYPNNANVTTTICPATVGDVVTVTFTSFNTDSGDLLSVYNGDNNFGTLLGTYSGNTLPPVLTSSASNGCLTFVFTSNATTNAAGWIANVTCAPPPPCQQPIGLTISDLLSTSATLTWTSPGSATTWQVLALPCAAAEPTAATTGWTSTTSNPYAFTDLLPNTCYKLYVRSDCSDASNGVSEWSTPITITTQIAPPVCGGNYVDSGGTTANYANSEDIVTTICPSTPGDVVTVTFVSFNTEATWDGIYVFDGNSIGATPILSTNPIGNGPMTTPGAYWGTVAPEPFTSTSPNGCLTFHFLSDPSVNRPGFIANITCAPPTGCARPTALISTAVTNTTATISWTQPANADTTVASAWQVIAVPCGSPTPDATTAGVDAGTNPFTITGLTAVTCYDIYVRAVCSENSVWLGPLSITTDVNPPVCGGVYTDSAGPNANYADNSNSTVTICPDTVGDVVTVTFTSFNTEAGSDLLKVYNGNSTTGTLMGTFSGTNIPPVITSSATNGCLTFVFTSNGFTNASGWTADVTCGPPPPCQQPLALTASAVLSTSATLAWTNAGSATAWQVLAIPCTDPTIPSDTTTGWVAATTNPFTIPNLTADTCYRLYVRSDCSAASSGVSEWSFPITITTQVAPPVCGGSFVDPQGANANYANSTDSTVTICPNSPTDVVTVTFTSFDTETNWDGLLVYDGNSITSPQIASANGTGFGFFATVTGAYWGNNLTGANLPGPFTSSSVNGCLTFRFVSDPSVNRAGWVANVTCSPAPACPKPTALTAPQNTITSTSALLGWTELNPAVTSWQVYLVLQGQPAPLPDIDINSPAISTVSTNPALFTGLSSGTQYTFYVRSICPDGSYSLWSIGHNFSTLIINDDCSGALFAPVNSSAECGQIVAGTITGATASTVPLDAPCVGTADDDVWFQFIATNSYLNVSLQSIVGSTTNLNFAAYSGNCGTLTQIFCSNANAVSGVLNGLTVGDTYYLRVYSNGSTPATSNFNLCISTPSTCPTASTVCSLTDYANTTGVTSLGTIGCLFTSPNPAYFTIQVATSGPINYTLTQSTQPSVGGVPGPANIDVDYAAWGPFANQDEACTFIGSAQPFATPGIGVPVTQQTGCSYSAAPTETLNIANAIAGQFYIILITNFSNQPGYITLTQNNVANDPNHGETNCCPNATFEYNPVTYCKEAGGTNPVATIYSGSVAGEFSCTSPGLIFANTTTGEIDLAASTAGNYIVTNTVAETATCSVRTATSTIQIVEPVTASFTYPDVASYCNVLYTTPILPDTFTGATGGSFSASPNGGLYIDVNSGGFTPSLSSPGVYTVTYTVPGTGACVASNPFAIVTITAAPVPTFTQVQPICPGDPLADLPTVSSGLVPGITGIWSPAMNNTATTTYTFTPDAGLCALPTTMTISVGSTTPTFTQVAPICPGAPLAALPLTSLPPENIQGTWSPALDNTQTTTYTFTPTSGNCVATATMTIQVLPLTIVPTFTPVAPICPNGALTALPTTSNAPNSITGSWSPALDNTQTTTYTFTPDTGQCALPTTLDIIVNPELGVTVNNPTFCPGSTATVTATPTIPGSYNYVWTVPLGATDPGNVASFDTTIVGTYSVVITQVNTFCNNDFETPAATGTAPNLIADNLVPCWNTTAADGVIEIWPPGFEGVNPYSGNNLVELNANTPGTLYQDFNAIPGTSISVSFAHRGRQGTDVVGVEVGPVGGPYVSLGNFSDGNTAWGYHTANYTIPTTGGNNYTLRFVSVSSAGGSPSIGNLLDSVSISSLSCPSQPASGVVSIQTLPAPTVTVTEPTCTVQTGTIEVTSPLNASGGGLPANLFISEVTDEDVGSLTYIEIYNGTGATVDLSGYKLKVYNNGSSSASCDNQLAGMLNNNSTWVVALSSAANAGGITPSQVDQVFATCGGVNNNDNIRLTTSADVEIDLWGQTDGSVFTPANQPGYTYRRLNTATIPSLVWNAADWTALDPQDYTNVGQYSYFTSIYEYSLDNGTYTSATTYSGVAPGAHTITVHDLVTGCYSLPFDVTVDPIVGQLPTVTTITYATPVCQGTTNPQELPNTSAPGFTSGGTYSEDTTVSSGLVINQNSGLIDLVTSTVGFHTVKYEVQFDPNTCQSYGLSTFVVEIVANTHAIVGCTYPVSKCRIAQPNTVSPLLDPGFSPGAIFSAAPVGLSIDPNTGVITLATSTAGTYTITVDIPSNPTTCFIGDSGTHTITILEPSTPEVGFNYTTPVCSSNTTLTANPNPGFVTGGVFSTTASEISVDSDTGDVTILATTPSGSYDVKYTLLADTTDAGCQNGNTHTATIEVSAPISIGVIGDCQNTAFVLTVSPTTGTTFDASAIYSWVNSAGEVVGSAQTLTVTTADTYTVHVTINGCVSTAAPIVVSTEDLACVIQKGISVNGDNLNDAFDLSGFNVKKITIFNRYGMEVYSKTDYTNQWKGESNDGDKLPDGTYYYVFNRANGETRTGWIYINREN